MGEVIDLQAYKNAKYIERRKGIQRLTGMVGHPIDLEAMLAADPAYWWLPAPSPDEIIFTPDEIGY
jgi:hypothetical protein